MYHLEFENILHFFYVFLQTNSMCYGFLYASSHFLLAHFTGDKNYYAESHESMIHAVQQKWKGEHTNLIIQQTYIFFFAHLDNWTTNFPSVSDHLIAKFSFKKKKSYFYFYI